jgi:hypothetical protein
VGRIYDNGPFNITINKRREGILFIASRAQLRLSAEKITLSPSSIVEAIAVTVRTKPSLTPTRRYDVKQRRVSVRRSVKLRRRMQDRLNIACDD